MLLPNWGMHAPAHLFPDLLQLSDKALGLRLPLDHELVRSGPAAVVRKAQKVESGFTARAAIRSSRRRRSLISPAGFEPLLRKAEQRLPFGRIAFVSYRDGVVAVLFGRPWGQCGKIEIE